MNPQFSPYEYFSYFFPGATVFGAYYISFLGLPAKEPGAVLTLAVIGIAFVIGHAVAAVSALLEPLLWRQRPGSRMDPSWGMFGPRGSYEEAERSNIAADLERRYGHMPFRTAYNIAYTELQQLGKDAQLKVMNQQIGFYRNMSFACLLAAGLIGLAAFAGHAYLTPLPWILFFVVSTLLFIYRYRRFWRYFGDNVIRGFRALPPRSESPREAPTVGASRATTAYPAKPPA